MSEQERFSGLRNLTLTRTCLGLVNAMFLAGAAHGQSTNTPPAAPNDEPGRLPDVTVSGEQETYRAERLENPRYTEPLRDIPQTVTVIPQAMIQEQNATTLRDVLRNVPGISIQAGEGGGGLPGDNLSIRGFNARSDIFVDGVRDYGAYSRDPFNIEQVEVLKGPTSTTVGRGSAGGAINMITKRPTLRQFYSGSAGIGTDEYGRATLDVNQPLKGVGLESSSLRLNGLYHTSDMPGRDEVTNERWSVAPSFSYGLGTATRLTLQYQHMNQDNVPDYGLPWVPDNTNPLLAGYSNQAPPVNFSNFYGLRGYDFEEIRSDSVTAIVEHDFNDSLRLRNLSRFGATDRDSAITAPRFDNVNTSTLIRRQLQQRQMEHSVYANQTDVNFEFDTGPVGHALTGGLEVSRETQDNRNSAQFANQPLADLFDPNPGDAPLGPMPTITGPWSEATADTVGLYVGDTLKLTEQWQLVGGLRYDHIETDFEGTGSRTDDLLSWRSGVVFKPKENGSIYFGYGTAFNPSLEGNTGFSGAILNLDPEESQMFELGTKWDFFHERLSLSAAVFRSEKTNARTPDIATPTVTVLEGEQRVDGVEFGAAGNITKEWRIYAAYTFMEAEVKASNNPAEVANVLANTPDHSVSLWTTYALPFNLEIGGGAQYVGERRSNNTTTARVAPDYWLFDAMGAYRVNDNITVRLNVYNLADERYIDRVGGGHFVPGAGRSAVLSANFNF
ncbi:MAG TPA: TonB-dependent siderophore receptor [Methylomirabilota bacterium]|nr:TonB-dependent siderophore receptor [Methylomirabilota bacterium]